MAVTVLWVLPAQHPCRCAMTRTTYHTRMRPLTSAPHRCARQNVVHPFWTHIPVRAMPKYCCTFTCIAITGIIHRAHQVAASGARVDQAPYAHTSARPERDPTLNAQGLFQWKQCKHTAH
ncbi:hypothetical protein BC834DRAFT_632409 [Gloeopeniophorella convolvens]|nr:hypothetical protein BC834DRAFT_632409 [Gloeopeniophorella convolvens]